MNTYMENQISTMKWYIVRSQSNRERSVAEKLRKESEKTLINKVGRILVPIEKSFFLKNGKKVSREKVMYPGYIFVETNSVGELAYFVKGCDGATSILSHKNGDPQVIKNAEVDRMLGIEKETQQKQETTGKFIVGEEIKIMDGPFSGFVGKIESILDQKAKVAVLIFGRQNIVELGLMQLDKN